MAKKFIIASDLHGSVSALERVIEKFKKFGADKLILLGDIFGANATKMVGLLNEISDKLTIIRGNNDWYFEPENAKFSIFNETYENINGVIAYLCHGHKLNDMNLAEYGAKIIMMGHIHRPMLRQEQGVIWICPGSMAVPRSGFDKCFAFIDENNNLKIMNEKDDVIYEIKI